MDLKKNIMKAIPQPKIKAYGIVRDKFGKIKGEEPKEEKHADSNNSST